MISRRPASLAFLLILLLAGGRAGVARADADDPQHLKDMLRDVITAQPTYRGTKSVTFWSSRGSDSFMARTYREGIKSRFEYVATSHRASRVVLEDDRTVYYYQPKDKLLITSERRDQRSQDLKLLDIAFKNYDWTSEGEALVAGHHATVLKASSHRTGEVAERLWVDKVHHVILRKESYNGRGELYLELHFADIEFPSTIDASIFKLETPADTKTRQRIPPVRLTEADINGQIPESEIKRLLGFVPLVPGSLPGGFELVGIQRENMSGHRALRLSFSDGLDTVSLVELPANVHQKKDVRQLEKLSENLQFEALTEGNLLQWRDQKLFYTLVGSLPKEEMTDMFHAMNTPPPVAHTEPPPHQPPTLLDYFWRGLDKILGRTK